ncbi:MAG: hypothetical protein NVS2B4_03630 [Ramlibacter sp.]
MALPVRSSLLALAATQTSASPAASVGTASGAAGCDNAAHATTIVQIATSKRCSCAPPFITASKRRPAPQPALTSHGTTAALGPAVYGFTHGSTARAVAAKKPTGERID